MQTTIISITLIITITAFLKEQFSLEGKQTKWAAFGVFMVVWGAPYIISLFPEGNTILQDFFTAFEVFLAALGAPSFMKYTARQFSTPAAPNFAALENEIRVESSK